MRKKAKNPFKKIVKKIFKKDPAEEFLELEKYARAGDGGKVLRILKKGNVKKDDYQKLLSRNWWGKDTEAGKKVIPKIRDELPANSVYRDKEDEEKEMSRFRLLMLEFQPSRRPNIHRPKSEEKKD